MAKSKITFFKIVLFSFLLLLGIGVRIIPVNNLKNGDIMVHLDWSKTLYTQNLNNIYFYPNWLYTPPTQPPLIMLGFWTSRHLYENRYLLSELHNSIRIPPASVIIWFDKYGEFLLLRLWAVLGDIACAFLVYFLIKKHIKNYKVALLGFILMLFNPLSLFETTLWGQNDIVSILFTYLAFIFIKNKKASILSPPLYLVGILIKPTSLVLAPIYIFYFFKNIKLNKANVLRIMLSSILCFVLIYFSFKPFLILNLNPATEIYNIVVNRITSSSKGLSRASNSGFNLYSLVFEIDKTYGGYQILGLSLDQISIVFYLILNAISIYILTKKSKQNAFIKLVFVIFFIGQGTFLFVTGMLERYFFPAFLASILLIFLNFRLYGFNMILQNIIWFLNLFYSFYQRDLGWIKTLFEGNSNLLIRTISLISLINFILIYKKFIRPPKRYSATNNQD
jgi:Gpi18-like mannosyltransferase